MELDGPNVIEVSQKSEKAPAELVVPHLDLVVVAPRDQQRLGVVKVDASDGPIVLLEPVNDRPNAVVPSVPLNK
jgi:hypothetical protein